MKIILQKSLGWHDIVLAQDGQIAWDKLMAETYDLIISDWTMPRKTGDELLAEVRQHAKTRHIPFLMVTAYATTDKVLSAIQGGVSDFIVKPFAKNLLIDKVRSLVEDPGMPSPASSTAATDVPLPETDGETVPGRQKPGEHTMVAPATSFAVGKPTPATPEFLTPPAAPWGLRSTRQHHARRGQALQEWHHPTTRSAQHRLHDHRHVKG